jgi:hypothetical protein
MMLRSFFNHPIVKQARAAGEERFSKAVAQLLSGDRAGATIQSVLAAAGEARQSLDRALRAALDAARVPSTQDVEDLKRRLAEMEELLDGLAARLARTEAGGEGPKEAPGDEVPPTDDGG